MTTEHLLRAVSARKRASERVADGSARRIREAARLSTGEVALAIGVTRQTINNWESGKSAPRGVAGDRWADLLDELQQALAGPSTTLAA